MGYFYHGVADGVDEESLDHVIEVLKSGKLKARQELWEEYCHRDSKQDFNHVCLYKKNPEYDYHGEKALSNSARGGWIDHCFLFIISPDIDAEKTSSQYTNLVDEWRSHGSIPFDKVVGIGLPLDNIEEFKIEFPELAQEEYQQKLDLIVDFAKNMGWTIENSDEVDFCDKLDKKLDDQKSL